MENCLKRKRFKVTTAFDCTVRQLNHRYDLHVNDGKKEKTMMKDLSEQPAPPGSTATLKRDVLEKILGPSSKN
ncbi:hypothetical protein T01_13336 [Trichinella spiralis]|uniref:Uncharacterized protein n=1 Tax=Trichinella spiralis TaxID=6334 RepID=A0A0V1AMI9_TRISP|nr:hypothetical protein T01_13336 [Trichinella spiralis]